MTRAENYEPYIALAAEGQRIGVMACRRCGALVLLDRIKEGRLIPELHDEWHEKHDSEALSG